MSLATLESGASVTCDRFAFFTRNAVLWSTAPGIWFVLTHQIPGAVLKYWIDPLTLSMWNRKLSPSSKGLWENRDFFLVQMPLQGVLLFLWLCKSTLDEQQVSRIHCSVSILSWYACTDTHVIYNTETVLKLPQSSKYFSYECWLAIVAESMMWENVFLSSEELSTTILASSRCENVPRSILVYNHCCFLKSIELDERFSNFVQSHEFCYMTRCSSEHWTTAECLTGVEPFGPTHDAI